MTVWDGGNDNISVIRSDKMIEGSEIKEDEFVFPSAEQLRKAQNSSRDRIKRLCKEDVENQLNIIKKSVMSLMNNSFLIVKNDSFSLELYLECSREILEGKGFDISTVDNGRTKGVVVKW